jgi:uncharacterized membrane protein YoaK (UPF0700 family)
MMMASITFAGHRDGYLAEVRQVLRRPRAARDDLVTPLLVALTVVTGLVDSFSYLQLGHVIVANMTGNMIFMAFGLAGASGFSVLRSLVAIGAFGLGALAAAGLGRAVSRLADRHEMLLAISAAVQAVPLAGAIIMAALTTHPATAGFRYPMIVLLAAAMGAQNATARSLAVPDLTTTLLTLTITGLAADSRLAGGPGAQAPRRLIPMVAMLAGALIGTLLMRHVWFACPLVIAMVILAAVAVTGCLVANPAADLRPARALIIGGSDL